MSINIVKSTTDSNTIRNIVNEVVSDQLFLRNIIQQLSLENCVQKELGLKLPSHVQRIKDKVKTYVHEITNTKLTDFQRDTIPSQVAKELTNQITAFLNNNTQMNQIIDYHTTQLNKVLTDTASRTLAELVNEPQYHLTTNAHLNAMDTKCDLKILEIQSVLNQQLTNNYQFFNEQLTSLKNTNDRELKELKDTLQDVKQFKNDFSSYKVITSHHDKHIKEVNDKVTSLQWLFGISIVVFGTALYILK